LYRLFNIGTDSAVVIFGQFFIWFLSDCKHFPCQNFPNLESLLQDSFALLWGLTIYVIWKYQMKFKFLSAALAGLFLSFSSVVDAAPVRYDFTAFGTNSTVSGYVVVDVPTDWLDGENLFSRISDWSFEWLVGNDRYSRTNLNGLLVNSGKGGFQLNQDGSVLISSIEVRGGIVPFETIDNILSVYPSYVILNTQGDRYTAYYLDGTAVRAGVGAGGWSGPIPVPEPSSLAIFALGIMGLALRRFKKQS
jgi:hypothetical protein